MKTKWRKSSEKIFCRFSILMQIPENWKSVQFKEFFCFYLFSFLKKKQPNPITMPIHYVQSQSQSIKTQKGVKWTTLYGWKIKKKIFAELFLHFVFFNGSHLVVLVAQISVSNKSYGSVDDIHAKWIVKDSYFKCFAAILFYICPSFATTL